jgi:lysophospholipase L1-like esterase
MGSVNIPSGGLQSLNLQTETITYALNIALIGGYIPTNELVALDAFVVKGKADGWWPLIKFFAPLMGSDINSAMVKLVIDASNSAYMTAINVPASDYDPKKGIVMLTNSTSKYISTGFIPSNNGCTATSIGGAWVVPDYIVNSGLGFQIGDNPVSGNTQITFHPTVIGTVRFNARNNGTRRVQSFSKNGNGTGQIYCNDTLSNNAASGVQTDEVFNTEVTIARCTRTGTVTYSSLGVGALLFSTGLTSSQQKSLNKSLDKLYKQTGRLPTSGRAICTFGDSITAAINASTPLNSFSYMLSRALGGYELNLGSPSSILTQSTTTGSGYAAGGFDRYTDLSDIDVNDIFITYGTNDMNIRDTTTSGNSTFISDYQTKYTTICNFFLTKAARVISLSIPYCGYTIGLGNSVKAAAYLAANYAAAVAANIPFVDLWNTFLDTGNPDIYFAADKIHPLDNGNLLIYQKALAAVQGYYYRDVLIPATSVGANSSVTQSVALYGLKLNHILQVGQPTIGTAGVIFSAAFTSNDTATITLTNNTGSPITTTQCNMRLLFNYQA